MTQPAAACIESRRPISRFTRRAQLRIALALCMGSTCAQADFFDKPYGLRLFQALDRQNNYVSTLGRQASLAFFDGASANPAAAGWRIDTLPLTTITTTYVDGASSDGRRIIAAPITARWQQPEHASVFLAYAHTGTLGTKGDDGLNQALASDEFSAGYSKRISQGLSAGASLRVTDGEIVNEAASLALAGAPARLKIHLSGPDLAIGLAGVLGDGVTAGASAALGWLRTTNRVENVDPLLLPSPASNTFISLPKDTVLDRFGDTVRSAALRGGLGIKLNRMFGVYGDFHLVHIASHRSGSLDVARVALGAEYAPADRWSLRAGVGIDTESQVTLSAGFGYRFGKTLDVQVGYQSNAAPEINREWGRSRLLAGSIALRF